MSIYSLRAASFKRGFSKGNVDTIRAKSFGSSTPAVCIFAFGFFINHYAVIKDLGIFSPMPLVRGDKPN
ncbi:MAG: hypothetical protein SV775_16740, partial [Thermodesulfobacteriota bacterium]|nr:hypothetical protein [Thermodesulfobacteriota bacterium]